MRISGQKMPESATNISICNFMRNLSFYAAPKFKRLLAVSCLLFLLSCQTNQPSSLPQLGQTYNLSLKSVWANQFEIRYLENLRTGQTLHIYIEGDGLPWTNRYTISRDPTPRKPLALELMNQDPQNAIYLTRPCYFLETIDEKCQASLWTGARYGEQVVDTLQNAIVQIVKDKQVNQVILIGYSGGGVLASLLATRLKMTAAYVTIAANLDIDKWTQHHQFTDLSESINPAELEPSLFPAALHFVGGKDKVVPQEVSAGFISQTHSQRIIEASFDHHCCWVKQWSNLLKHLEALNF